MGVKKGEGIWQGGKKVVILASKYRTTRRTLICMRCLLFYNTVSMTRENGVPQERLLIKGASVWLDGGFKEADVLTDGTVISRIAPAIEPEKDMRVFDARGLHLMPGLVDMHVHLREPGYGYKETIASGTRAAARGGFTTVCAMPNVLPAPDSAATLQQQLDIIDRDAVIEVRPYLTITRERKGHTPIDAEGIDMSRIAGFSDDGNGVQEADTMRQAMETLGDKNLFAVHCEVNSLLRGGYIHDGNYAREHGHKGICSESEWAEVKRDIELAAETGCRLHICHVSTAESVELVRRAKARGQQVSCETGPHYLAFSDIDLQEEGRFKMNPPLRDLRDREALRQGIIDGTVDVIATDHAPHSAEEKSRGLKLSAMGVVGLETSLGAVNTVMVESGLMSRERLVEVMSITPRRLLGMETELYEGAKADLTLVDFNREWTVDPSKFVSMGHSTPFEGMRLKGDAVMTVSRGRVVHDSLSPAVEG